MLDSQELEKIKIDIWDYIYQSGPQGIAKIATELQLSEESVRDAVSDVWFTVRDEVVSNAVVS